MYTGSSRDWKEDFSHENGNYQSSCNNCGQLFLGHKRRMICKNCSSVPASLQERAEKFALPWKKFGDHFWDHTMDCYIAGATENAQPGVDTLRLWMSQGSNIRRAASGIASILFDAEEGTNESDVQAEIEKYICTEMFKNENI